MHPIFKSASLFGSFPASPVLPSLRVTCGSLYGALMERCCYGKTEVNGEKSCPNTTFSTTNLTLNGMGSNPGLPGKKPALFI